MITFPGCLAKVYVRAGLCCLLLFWIFSMTFFGLRLSLLLCLRRWLGNGLSDFTFSAASRLTLVIMGRTPHRGRPSPCCLSGRPVGLNLIIKCTSRLRHQFDHKANSQQDRNARWCFPSHNFSFWLLSLLGICFDFTQNYCNCRSVAFILTVITVCISEAPKLWWAVQSPFWFQIKRRRRRRDEAASQQALPSTNLMVGNSDLWLVPLHCCSFSFMVQPKSFLS